MRHFSQADTFQGNRFALKHCQVITGVVVELNEYLKEPALAFIEAHRREGSHAFHHRVSVNGDTLEFSQELIAILVADYNALARNHGGAHFPGAFRYSKLAHESR